MPSANRNAALQRGLGPLTDPPEMGLLAENMVAGHLRALGEVGRVRLHFWREGKEEVDLIDDHPDAPLAFEVGTSAGHDRGGLKTFEARYPRFRGRCYHVAPELLARRPDETGDRIGTPPIDLVLLAVGGQVGRELARRLTD